MPQEYNDCLKHAFILKYLLHFFRASSIEFPQIGLAWLEVVDHSVTVHPFNPNFLKTQGDTFYGKLQFYPSVQGMHTDFEALF